MACYRRYISFIFIPVILLFISSCGDKGVQKTAATQAVTVQETADIVPVPDSADALVTFLTGEVLHVNSDGERIPEIGDSITVGDRLETGSDGFIELQFGNLGVIRIQADSSYQIEFVELGEESEKVSGSLGAGSIIAKIRRLTDKDGFEVSVPGAVCAVRGTEFLIRADESGSVTIAVAEGAVAIIPPSMAEVGVSAGIDGKLIEIRSLMPLVTADEELLITSDALVEVERELVVWNTSDPDADGEKLDLLESRIRSALIDVPEPEPIGSGNAAVLQDETPELLTVAVYSSTDGDSGADDTRSISVLVPLTVRTIPADARIYINNRSAGRGNVSQVFAEGMSVSVIAVTSDGRRLEREIIAGTESFVEFVFEDPVLESEPEPEVEAEVEAEISELMIAAPEKATVVKTSPEPVQEMVDFRVIAEPGSAVIYINGRRLGTGSVDFEGIPGDEVTIRVERPGFAVFSRDITLRSASVPLRVNLEPEPIIAETRLPDDPAVGTLVSSGDIVVGTTASGTLYAVNRSGKLIWTRETSNRGGENTTPVIAGNRVYVIGDSELVIVNIFNGRVLVRQELTGDRGDLFGRRILDWGGHLILPSDSSLVFLNPDNGETEGMMSIPGGSHMTPAVWNKQIIIADQRGTLLYIDPDAKSIIRTVATGASQPIGQAPVINRNVAVFSGRRGTVTAVNLQSGQVIWERSLDENRKVQVHTDVVIDHGIVYVFGDGTLYAMKLENGENQFAPIPGVSAPPLVRNGILYLCRNDGILSMHNQRHGGSIGEFHLNEVSTVRPAGLGPYLVAATERRVFILDPRSMTE